MKSTLLLITFILTGIRLFAQDTIVIDTSVHYQTMAGWGHGGGVLGHVGGPYLMLDTAVANPVNFQTLDYLTDDLGLTGSRTWEVGPRTDGTGMDNGDCDSIDWNKFQSQSLPPWMAAYLVYYKNKIISHGYQPNFYSSPGYPTHATDQKPWIMFHPGERAQQIWASSLYMKNTYGIDISYDVIYNEPSGSITPGLLAEDIKALAPRLQSLGLTTRSQFPEAVAPSTAWNNFITPLQNDSDLWANTGRISYHNYGTADPYRSMIYNFGLSKGITTAQTEMANATFDDLYSDLTLANVSYWEVAYSAYSTLPNDSGLTSFTPSSTYFRLRQVLHYIRPGDIRVHTVTNDSLLHLLAFKNNNGVAVIIENTSPIMQNIFLSGIPSGMYGLSRSSPGATAFQELGLHTVSNDTITIPIAGGSSVTTIYSYAAPDHAPEIMTYRTIPGFLVAPVSTATLVSTANDAELDPLTYQWTVISFPAGANPILANPNNASTSVSGLTSAGNYIFNIDVYDGMSTSSKKVYLIAYSAAPPVVLGNCGFRIAAPYGLVFGNAGDTTHANIELPTTSVILQANAGTLSNSNLSGQGTWWLVQQPAGANAIVDTTIYIFVSLRAIVTNMNVPGDYIFQINVLNPGHPDLTQQVICTVHPASSPPVINSITPSPAVLTLPVTTSLLTAVTSDPNLDLLRHWWAIVAAPAGAYPQFDHQCRPVTNVSGLTIPGLYTFQLRAFDDLHEVTQNVSITVNATGIENVAPENGFTLYPNPVVDELTVILTNSTGKAPEIKIINVFGETVIIKITKQPDGKLFINLKSLPGGIYFIEIKTADKISAGKIIKL